MARQMKDSGIAWIGEIPADWSVVPLQYHADLNAKSLSEDTAPEYEFDYVEIGSVTLEGGINEYEHVKFADAPSRARRIVQENDIIVSTVRTYLKAIAIVPASENVIVSTGFAVLTPKNIDVSFLGFFLKSEYFVNMVTANSVGISYPAINASDLVKFRILLPSVVEQHRIAAFLDRRCAEIDAVIERTKATIEEYKKLKQAVITEAVTKGVRGPRPMKDSGIEWIGEIPETWNVVRIKNLFDYRNERNYAPLEEVNLISLYTDKGVVQHCDLEETTGNKASNADGYKLVYEDDIVVNIILCWMGAIGRSAYNGVTSPAYDVYAPMPGTNSRFYHHLFRTQGFSGDCYKVGRGIMAMRWRTYSDQFRALKVVCPPTEEQEEIIAYLDEKCAALDTLIAKKTDLLTELETYKKSLIYEYVTGKKEVPACP